MFVGLCGLPSSGRELLMSRFAGRFNHREPVIEEPSSIRNRQRIIELEARIVALENKLPTLGQCQWAGCQKAASLETLLGYRLCEQHFGEYFTEGEGKNQ